MVAFDGQQISEIAGNSIPELASEFGAPTYFYDGSVIKKRIEELKSFDVIRYAQKACSNLSVLSFVKKHGAFVDAVSAGEVMRAQATGFRCDTHPAEVVYTCDIFDQDALDLVKKHNVHCNLGSPDMIDQIAKVSPGASVTLRINPGFGHGHSQKTNTGGPQSKHGIWNEQLAEVTKRCNEKGLKVTGLHMHIGSGTDFDHLKLVCAAMDKCAREVGPTVDTISCGGGLPISYQSTQTDIDVPMYFQVWDQTRKGLEETFGHKVTLEIEPGRFLAAESGYLVSEIRAVKKMGDNLFYLLDAGFNNLSRPILYGAYHPMAVCSRDGRKLDQTAEVIVGGPLCESGDIFTQEEGGTVSKRNLPLADVGDFLVIGCAGAYGYVMSSNYNSRPMAAEVFIEDGTARLARRRQTLEEVFANELDLVQA